MLLEADDITNDDIKDMLRSSFLITHIKEGLDIALISGTSAVGQNFRVYAAFWGAIRTC